MGDDVHVGIGRPDGGSALERAAIPFESRGDDVDSKLREYVSLEGTVRRLKEGE